MAQLKLDEMAVLLVEPSTTQRRIIEKYLDQLGVESPVSTGAGVSTFAPIGSGQLDLVFSGA